MAVKVPDYMVPTAIVVLDRLPLTVNGKLDRAKLPAPAPAAAGTGRAPRNATEQVLAAAFGDVLGQDGRVGVDDNFFELGGHSLLAARLISKARQELGARLAIRDLFEAPTVAGLATRVVREETPLPPLVRTGLTEAPLSYAQRRLWFLQQLSGQTATYNIPLVIHLDGPVDSDALRAALTDVTDRHEALRTVFVERDNRPVQRVLTTADHPVDYRVLDVAETELADAVQAEVTRGFDLAADFPLRAALLRVAPDRHVLALVFHHIAADEWSVPPFVQELTAAYTARSQGQAPDWQPLPVQYLDYAQWQSQMLGDPLDAASTGARQIAYWKAALAGIPDELPLPTDRPARPSPPGAAAPSR